MSDNEYEGGEGETCYSFHRNMPRIVNIDMKRLNLDLDNKTFPPFNFIFWCGTGIFLLGWVDFRLFAIFDIQ